MRNIEIYQGSNRIILEKLLVFCNYNLYKSFSKKYNAIVINHINKYIIINSSIYNNYDKFNFKEIVKYVLHDIHI